MFSSEATSLNTYFSEMDLERHKLYLNNYGIINKLSYVNSCKSEIIFHVMLGKLIFYSGEVLIKFSLKFSCLFN